MRTHHRIKRADKRPQASAAPGRAVAAGQKFVAKCLTLITAGLLPITAAAASDFRTLNFGDSCLAAEAAEYRLGNSPKTGAADRHNQYAFNGVFLDRAVTIVYHCGEHGQLEQGSYIFEFSSERDLEMFYRVARPGLEHQLGPPTFDGATLNPGRRYDSFDYALRWDGLRTTINLKVVGNFDDRNTRKRLQIWYRPTR